jgi:IS1 family transposase
MHRRRTTVCEQIHDSGTRCKLWISKVLDRDTSQLLDRACERRDQATLKKMVDRLMSWDVQMYCTDKWGTYASVIPQDKLVQSKATTRNIARHHWRQHYWSVNDWITRVQYCRVEAVQTAPQQGQHFPLPRQ